MLAWVACLDDAGTYVPLTVYASESAGSTWPMVSNVPVRDAASRYLFGVQRGHGNTGNDINGMPDGARTVGNVPVRHAGTGVGADLPVVRRREEDRPAGDTESGPLVRKAGADEQPRP